MGAACPTARDCHPPEAPAAILACARPVVPDAIRHAAAALPRAPSVAVDNLGEELAEADLRLAHAAAPQLLPACGHTGVEAVSG